MAMESVSKRGYENMEVWTTSTGNYKVSLNSLELTNNGELTKMAIISIHVIRPNQAYKLQSCTTKPITS